MRFYISHLLLIAFCGLLFSCQSVRVKVNYSEEVDFLAYKNFAWLAPAKKQNNGYIGLGEQNLQRLIRESLNAKGLSESSLEEADVLIAVNITEKEKVYYTTHRGGYYPYHGWGYSHHWVEPEQYTESTLVLAFVDPKTKQALWEASAKNTHFDEMDDENLKKIIDSFFNYFPPLPSVEVENSDQ